MPYKFSRRQTQPQINKSRSGIVRKNPKNKYKKRPVRFQSAGSQRQNKSDVKVVKSLVRAGVLELKQKQGTSFNEKPLVVRCTNNIQYVNFTPALASTGSENANPLDNITFGGQGTASNQYVGRYINVKSLFMRYCIQVPMIDEGTASHLNDFKGMTERHLRVILVAPRETSVPMGVDFTTDGSLFLDYDGSEYGLAAATDKPAWEILSAPINKKNWIVLKDRHMTVSPNRIDTFGAPGTFPLSSNPAFAHTAVGGSEFAASWNETHSCKLGGKSELNIDCRLPINKKVEMNTSTNRPINLNVGYRFIVISGIPGMKQSDQKTTNAAVYGTNRVLVSSRSFIQYHDA